MIAADAAVARRRRGLRLTGRPVIVAMEGVSSGSGAAATRSLIAEEMAWSRSVVMRVPSEMVASADEMTTNGSRRQAEQLGCLCLGEVFPVDEVQNGPLLQ